MSEREELDGLLESIYTSVVHGCHDLFKNILLDKDPANTTARETVLFLLKKRGSMQVTELSGELMVTKANVSMLVTKLVKEGLVEKEQSRADKRVFHLSLTEKGRQYVEDRAALYRFYLRTRLAALSEEEIRQLKAALEFVERMAVKIKNQPEGSAH